MIVHSLEESCLDGSYFRRPSAKVSARGETIHFQRVASQGQHRKDGFVEAFFAEDSLF